MLIKSCLFNAFYLFNNRFGKYKRVSFFTASATRILILAINSIRWALECG